VHNAPFAIFSDLDGTLTAPHNPHAARDLAKLVAFVQEHGWPLIAVSGQRCRDTIDRVLAGRLPKFAAVIGTVGTELRLLQPNGRYAADEEYSAWVRRHGYDRQYVAERVQSLLDTARLRLPVARLDWQYPEEEEKFLAGEPATFEYYKVSCHFFASSAEEVAGVARLFEDAFPSFQIVTCEEIDHNRSLHAGEPRKFCLDVVPVAKASAVNYVIETYAIGAGLVAGDSGNDVDMLLDTPGSFVGVLVAGHTEEARARIQSRALPRGKQMVIDTSSVHTPPQSILKAAHDLAAGRIAAS
jgi:hydroxymethylpyrimidine pyrophosphatase-like HAD family hydrolase